jgi:peptidoglycan/LPS O-acetylase OafA/YrhL
MKKTPQGYRRLSALRWAMVSLIIICIIAALTAILSPAGIAHVATVFAATSGAIGTALWVYFVGDAYAKSKAPESTDVKE